MLHWPPSAPPGGGAPAPLTQSQLGRFALDLSNLENNGALVQEQDEWGFSQSFFNRPVHSMQHSTDSIPSTSAANQSGLGVASPELMQAWRQWTNTQVETLKSVVQMHKDRPGLDVLIQETMDKYAAEGRKIISDLRSNRRAMPGHSSGQTSESGICLAQPQVQSDDTESVLSTDSWLDSVREESRQLEQRALDHRREANRARLAALRAPMRQPPPLSTTDDAESTVEESAQTCDNTTQTSDESMSGDATLVNTDDAENPVSEESESSLVRTGRKRVNSQSPPGAARKRPVVQAPPKVAPVVQAPPKVAPVVQAPPKVAPVAKGGRVQKTGKDAIVAQYKKKLELKHWCLKMVGKRRRVVLEGIKRAWSGNSATPGDQSDSSYSSTSSHNEFLSCTVEKRLDSRKVITSNQELVCLVGAPRWDVNEPAPLEIQGGFRCGFNASWQYLLDNWRHKENGGSSTFVAKEGQRVMRMDQLNVTTTRSGRPVIKPLEWWCREKVSVKGNMMVYTPTAPGGRGSKVTPGDKFPFQTTPKTPANGQKTPAKPKSAPPCLTHQSRGSPSKTLNPRGSPSKTLNPRGSPSKTILVRRSPVMSPSARALQSRGSQSKAVQSRGSQSKAVQSRGSQSKAVQSKVVQSKGSQSKAVQSSGSQSRAVQSKGSQSKAVQSRGSQSKVVQPRRCPILNGAKTPSTRPQRNSAGSDRNSAGSDSSSDAMRTPTRVATTRTNKSADPAARRRLIRDPQCDTLGEYFPPTPPGSMGQEKRKGRSANIAKNLTARKRSLEKYNLDVLVTVLSTPRTTPERETGGDGRKGRGRSKSAHASTARKSLSLERAPRVRKPAEKSQVKPRSKSMPRKLAEKKKASKVAQKEVAPVPKKGRQQKESPKPKKSPPPASRQVSLLKNGKPSLTEKLVQLQMRRHAQEELAESPDERYADALCDEDDCSSVSSLNLSEVSAASSTLVASPNGQDATASQKAMSMWKMATVQSPVAPRRNSRMDSWDDADMDAEPVVPVGPRRPEDAVRIEHRFLKTKGATRRRKNAGGAAGGVETEGSSASRSSEDLQTEEALDALKCGRVSELRTYFTSGAESDSDSDTPEFYFPEQEDR